MKTWIKKGFGLVAILIVAGVFVAGCWIEKNRENDSGTQDNTFLYDAAAMFDNQNYVRW